MDKFDPWQVVPRQIFTPYSRLLISTASVVGSRVGCLGVTGVVLTDSLFRKQEMTSTADQSFTTHAEASFDPALYSSLFYSGKFVDIAAEKIYDWLIEKFHAIFSDGILSGKRMLDIGTGPVIPTVVTASKWFDKIYLSDFSRTNIEFLQKWRRGESQHLKPLMESFAQKESATWETLNERVLGKVKDVVKCDVNKPNPLSGTVLEAAKFDVITSCLCLSVAALTVETFVKALRSISTILKPGGMLIIVDILDHTFYEVGDKKFKALPLTYGELQNALKAADFGIVSLDTTWYSTLESTCCNGNTMYSVVAKKQVV